MSRNPTLYIDIDDTIIAQVLTGTGFDMRPCVITQLAVLARMYHCCWLTSWPYCERRHPKSRYDGISVVTLMRCLYGTDINERFEYAFWDKNHQDGKAGYVLRLNRPQNWYWLENPLFKQEQMALEAAGKLDRYISVEPKGPWGFLDAVNELFRRSGKTNADIKRVGGRPEWFDRAFIASG